MLVHFCEMDHQKIIFLLILAPFLWEAVEASRCYFFYKLVQDTQMSKPPKATWHNNSTKFWSFYPSEPIQKAHFNMRHPVVAKKSADIVSFCNSFITTYLYRNPNKHIYLILPLSQFYRAEIVLKTPDIGTYTGIEELSQPDILGPLDDISCIDFD